MSPPQVLDSLLLAWAKWWEGNCGASAAGGGQSCPCSLQMPSCSHAPHRPATAGLRHLLSLLQTLAQGENSLDFGWSRASATKSNTVIGISVIGVSPGVLRGTILLSLLWCGSFFGSSGCHPAYSCPISRRSFCADFILPPTFLHICL